MRTRIKICGITQLRDALIASECGADALGFIFYEKSPRYVQPEIAKGIIEQLPPFVIPVGVFVNATREYVNTVIRQTNIKALQFSGDETPEECCGYELPVIKTFRIKNENEIEIIKSYNIAAILLDSGGNGEYGGTGKCVDAAIVKIVRKKYPAFILAGGISPENVKEIITTLQPFALDVNSGVENIPGQKNEMKLRALFEQIQTPSKEVSFK